MKEEWKSLKGLVECGDYYEVSNLGRVRSIDREIIYSNGDKHFYKGKIMKLNKNKNGYLYVMLKNKGEFKNYLVHRLVGIAFISNPNDLPEINHINELEKENNHVDNLEWCDSEYNHNYGTRIERSGIGHRKPIKCWKYPSMEFVKEFESIKEASEFLDIKHANITNFFYRKYKQTHGYYFEFTKDDNNA